MPHAKTPKPYPHTDIHDVVLYLDGLCHMIEVLVIEIGPRLERAARALELQHEDMHRPPIPHSP